MQKSRLLPILLTKNAWRVQLLTFFALVRDCLLRWSFGLLLAIFHAGIAHAGAASASDFAFISPQLETIGDAQSIPEGVVTALAQDAQGFIWIGTQAGLIRYDGYRFRKYLRKANDANSLSGNYIVSLMAAKDGRLWVGTNSEGLAVFDPASEKFTRFAHSEKAPSSLSAGRIWAIVEDVHGGVWLGSDHGLDYLAPHITKNLTAASPFTHFRHQIGNPKSLLSDVICALLIDRKGRLWVGSIAGLQRLSVDGKQFETPAAGGLEKKNIQSLFQAQDGKLWVGTAEHGAAWLEIDKANAAYPVHWLMLNKHSQQTRQTTQRSIQTLPANGLSHEWVSGFAQVQADQIWLATYGGGINIVSAQDGRVLQHLRHDPAVKGSLALDAVVPLLLDRSGLLWIGTWAGGLQHFNSKNNMVRTLRHSPSLPHGLSSPDVRSVLELADGRILLGTNGNGIDIIDRKRGLIGGYRAGPAAGGGLPDASIYSLAQTADGSIWAGTQQAGVLCLPAGSQTWQVVPGLPNQQAKSLLASRDGSLWVGTSSGVARLSPQQVNVANVANAKRRFEVVTNRQGQRLRSRIYALAEDDKGRIWAGSDNGLWVYDGQDWAGIHKDTTRASGLQSELASGLLFDQQRHLWVTSEQGLARLSDWDGKQAQFEHVRGEAGLAGKAIGGNLLQDKHARIWTEAALFDPRSKLITLLGKADGVDHGSSWSGAHAKTRDGLLLFAGTQGVSIIDPRQFSPWSYMPPVVISNLNINNQAVPLGALATAQGKLRPSLTLQPEQRDFAIEFAALDYSAPKKNRYQYRLQGYDKEWINSDFEHRSAAYGNLPPGSYILQVRGSNRSGQWSSQELTIAIQVKPAFWQTAWFLAFLLFLTATTIALGYRWRVAHLHLRARNLQALIDARTADILKLAEIGRELTATLDTEQAFARIFRQVQARLDADVFLIGMVTGECIRFVYKIAQQKRLPDQQVGLDQLADLAVCCVREQRELLINPRAAQQQVEPHVEHWHASEPPMQTVLYLPLLAERKVIGCLSVQSQKQNAYNQDQREFLRVLASYTAIALSNSTAHTALAQSHSELGNALQFLKETQAKLIQAERRQISLDLHDNLSQTMTGILLQLETARDVLQEDVDMVQPSQTSLPYVDRAIDLARDGIVQTRHLLNQLRSKILQPPTLHLVDALLRDLPRLTVDTSISVNVEQTGQPMPMSAALELVLFRVAQESVTNAIRHAGAKTIHVLLTYESACIILSVRDDGCGFDPAAPANQPGIGLNGMRERITALGGALEVESAIGQGTCVRAIMKGC